MSSSDNFPDVGDVPGVAIPRPIGELPSCTQVYATEGLRSQRGVSGAERGRNLDRGRRQQRPKAVNRHPARRGPC
jgi:hypothetical protein